MAFPVTEEFLHYESGESKPRRCIRMSANHHASLGIFHPYPEEGFEKRIIYWHVVRLIGWGHDKDDKHYWIAINSFGAHWGDNGKSNRLESPLKTLNDFRSLQNGPDSTGTIRTRVRNGSSLATLCVSNGFTNSCPNFKAHC